jgi:transglutaminase-like putative cysteine protease
VKLQALSLPDNQQFELRGIAGGVAGTRQTLAIMAELAGQYKADPYIRYTAENIIAGVPGKDWTGEASAIQAWVRDSIRYTQDVNGIETLKTPDVTLQTMQGDCDDKALLAASLLESIGHPARFVAVATLTPGDYDHVYVETKIGNAWRGVETTEDVPFGWSPPRVDYPIMRNVP